LAAERLDDCDDCLLFSEVAIGECFSKQRAGLITGAAEVSSALMAALAQWKGPRMVDSIAAGAHRLAWLLLS
jgi:hypothetical protein